MRTPLDPPDCDVAAAHESGLPAGQTSHACPHRRTPVLRTAIVIATLMALHAWAPFSMPQVGPGSASTQPGTIVKVAGNGEVVLGDGGPAAGAQLAVPADVAMDGSGNLYITDHWNHRVRKVDPAGIITTVAGTGERVYSGVGGPATEAQLVALHDATQVLEFPAEIGAPIMPASKVGGSPACVSWFNVSFTSRLTDEQGKQLLERYPEVRPAAGLSESLESLAFNVPVSRRSTA